MDDLIKNINLSIDSAWKITSILFRLGVFSGVSIFFIYCSKIGYFPTGVDLGDSVLFIILSGCFGFLYFGLVLSLFSFGTLFYPVFIWVKFAYCFLNKNFYNRLSWHLKINIDFIKPSIPFFVIGIGGAILILSLGGNDFLVIFDFIIISVALVFGVSLIISLENKINNLERDVIYMDVVHRDISTNIVNKEKIKSRKQQIVAIVFLFIMPIVFSKTSDVIINEAMKMTGFRRHANVIFVKKPFSEFIPNYYLSKNINSLSGYKEYQGMLILFKGIGKNVVLEYRKGDKINSIIIPNDSVLMY